MKILVVGDLHGNKPKIFFKDFDAIIMPGDVCSDKYLRRFYDTWMKSEWNKSREEQLNFEDFVKKKFNVTKTDLKKLDKLSLKDGRKIMKFLNSFNKPVFFVPGNWDQSYNGKWVDEDDEFKRRNNMLKMFSARSSNKKLIKGLKNVNDCQLKTSEFCGFNIIGYGLSSTPEFPITKRAKIKNKAHLKKLRKKYLSLLRLLENVYSKRNKQLPTIFLSHNVPYKTKLDIIRKKGSPVKGEHYGSMIARDFIKKYKPLLCIGAHMHENFGKDRIGKTICVNAGFGSYVNTLIDLDEETGKIKKIIFKKGKKH